jgi:hypothetical protein
VGSREKTIEDVLRQWNIEETAAHITALDDDPINCLALHLVKW